MKSRIIFAAAAASLSMAAYAQTTDSQKNDNDEARLKKEITVDRHIVPQLREAYRMSLTPVVQLPAVSQANLDYSTRTVSTRVPALFSPLSPAAYADSIAISPWRGYLTVGYFPALDQLVSAGYNIINRQRTQLGAWLQYDASFFHDKSTLRYGTATVDMIEEFKLLYRRSTFTGGLGLTQAIGSSSELKVNLDYTFDKHTVPSRRISHPELSDSPIGEYDLIRTDRQRVNRFNAQAIFSSTVNDLRYSIGAKYNIFAFGNSYLANPADKQNIYGIEGLLRTNPDDESQAMLGVSFTGIHDSNVPMDFYNPSGVDNSGYTQGLATISPTYRYESGNFTADLGVRVDLTFHSGKAFHIAPNVKIAWMPAQTLTVWAKAGGGEVQNTLASLFEFTPYIDPGCSYRNSHVPVTIDGGITFGPFKGAYAKLFGGWARANDWLMPANHSGIISLAPIDMKGYHVGAAIGYNYRRIINFEVSAEFAPQDIDKGYYLWRDRAKRVINASLDITPVKPLEINLAWQLRAGRKVYVPSFENNILPAKIDYVTGFDGYSTLSNVSIGGRWSFSPAVSVFLNLNNLLNRKDITQLGEPGRGLYGLAGFSLNF